MGITQSLQKAITDHPRFTKVQYGTDTNITVIHLEISDAQMKQWREKFNRFIGYLKGSQNYAKQSRIRLTYKNLLLIYDNDIRIVRDGFCSSSYKLLIKLPQRWSSNLIQQISNRQSINRSYSQPQIWIILLNIVSTIVPIHEKSLTSIFGNLHPSNILLNNHGELLLIGSVSLPKEKDHFEVYKERGCEGGFISPEMIGFLKSKSYKQYPHYPSCINQQKAEAYCLGLTILSLCCLQTNLSPLYLPQPTPRTHPHISHQSSSHHNYTSLLNMPYFNQLIHFIDTHYSRMLSMVIKCLLQNRPQDRLSITELWSVLLQDKRRYINAMDGRWFGEALQTIDENREQSVCENQDEETSEYTDELLLPNTKYPYKQKIKHSFNLDLSKIQYQKTTNIENYYENPILQPLKLYKQQDKTNHKIVFTYR